MSILGKIHHDPTNQPMTAEVLANQNTTREQQLSGTLDEILSTLKESTIVRREDKDTRTRFWTTYKIEAEEYDGEFLKKYNSDLDIVLIFAGLFSAVSTSFVTAMQSDLSPDPNDTITVLLKTIVHNMNSTAFADQNLDLPQWNGPNRTTVWIQSVLYASLAASLLAALGAVLGKQWLSQYSRIGRRGTIDARGKYRQQKLNGLQVWHFHAVMESLPLLLQVSLLLFGIGLTVFIWTLQHIIASILISAVAFGVLFYVFIVTSSLVSPDCPFQTPLSNFLRTMLNIFSSRLYAATRFTGPYAIQIRQYIVGRSLQYRYTPDRTLKTLCQRFFWDLLSATVRALEALPHLLQHSKEVIRNKLVSSSASSHSTLIVQGKLIDRLDAPSVAWILETSTDPGIIMAAAYMTPDIEWPVEFDVLTVLIQLRDTFLDCFERSRHGKPQLVARGRDRAFASGKALLHLYLERRNTNEDQMLSFYDPAWHTKRRDTIMGTRTPNFPDFQWLSSFQAPDVDLKFICDVLKETFRWSLVTHHLFITTYMYEPDQWAPSLPHVPDAHLIWVSHSVLHCLCDPDVPKSTKLQTIDVISRLLSQRPLPARNILSDCLLAAGLLMGMSESIDRKELTKFDKSEDVSRILTSVLDQVEKALPIVTDTPKWSDEGLYALELLEPLSNLIEVQEFRNIFYNKHIPLWSLHLSRQMARRTPEVILRPDHPDSVRRDWKYRLDYWKRSRSALRLSVLTAGPPTLETGMGQRMWHVRYERADRWSHEPPRGYNGPGLTTEDFVWVSRFVDHYHRKNDNTAVADGFLVLSQLPEVAAGMINPAFIHIVTQSMDSQHPTRLRHSALKLADIIIKHVMKRPDYEAFQSSLLAMGFSSALRSAAFPDESLSSPGGSEPLYPDGFLNYHRDKRYLDIIYSLSSNDVWKAALQQDGHLARCIDLAQKLKSIYSDRDIVTDPREGIWSAFTNPESYKRDLWSRLVHILLQFSWLQSDSNPEEELRWMLVLKAWKLYRADLLDKRFIPPIARYTIRIVSDKPSRRTESLVKRVSTALEWMKYQLKRGDTSTVLAEALVSTSEVVDLLHQYPQTEGDEGDDGQSLRSVSEGLASEWALSSF